MVSPTSNSISDHADIQMHLEILNNDHNSSKKHNIPQSKFLHPEPFKWGEDSAARFRDGLSNNPIIEMIKNFKNTNFTATSKGTNLCCVTLSDILICNAKICLRQPIKSKKKKKIEKDINLAMTKNVGN